MPTETVTVDFERNFPVFPLSDAIVLPQAMLPLHVFEPRYRRMIADILDSSGFLAMAMFRAHITPADYLAGHPALRPYVCVAQIKEYERLPAGRYVVLVQGICRARIVTEVPHAPYRMIRVGPLPEAPAPEGKLEDCRARIENLIHLRSAPARHGILDPVAGNESVSTAVIVDVAIAAVCTDTDQQYAMLAQTDVRRRAEWLIERMESILGFSAGQRAKN